jgi:hypothetical protein
MEISSARVTHWAEHYPGAAAAENSWNCHLKLCQKNLGKCFNWQFKVHKLDYDC